DMVAGKNQDIVRLFSVEEKQVLIDCIGCALIPFFTDSLLGWNRRDVFAEFGVEDAPARANMTVERVRFVLDEDGDFSKPRVEAVAQREIDNKIFPVTRNRRH